MGSIAPGLGSVVVSHQYGNIQILNSCNYNMMTLSTELLASSIILYTKLSDNGQHCKLQ